ncbi:ATPase H+ transporting accessory protein 1 like a isoform X1 [Solea solea]|uniref:ATPase H+ transporting accessory protein 1 like a isoform X1 n=2 Tax=Solea solea TaxID=90069 RepID=UPI002729714F|nr:ATPase H+ transporting accessory protein 1 like a isoform X1 [Solea solea]
MTLPWKHCCIFLLSLLLHHEPSSTCLDGQPADSVQLFTVYKKEAAKSPLGQKPPPLQSPSVAQRRLLQLPGAAVPFPPLKVMSNAEPCIMFQARKLSLRYENQKQLDLTEQAFSPKKTVDTSQSVCYHDKAVLVMRFGDVEDLRSLSIRLQLSNTFYESSGQWWFSVNSVSLLYNMSGEASFNASEVYAPTSSSYHCLHVSNLQHHSALLLPSSDHAHRWTVTFTDFRIQAFNISSGRFSAASDCVTLLTPAILMGLISSLILLLVLVYALHMVIHLNHIDNEHKAEVYFPQNPEQRKPCYVENNAEEHYLQCEQNDC